MKFEERSFPYPVLSPDRDDVQPGIFAANLVVTPEPQNYHLDFQFDLQNQTLLAMILTGTATYTIHVECGNNFFRRVFTSPKPQGRITIGADELVGAVEVSFFITATAGLADYRIDGSHADYGAASFGVRAGDVLAIAHGMSFDADKDYDPLKKISSIIQICPAPDVEDGPFSIDFDTQKITVFLSRKDHIRYGQLVAVPGITGVLVQGIVLAVLVESIAHMRQTPPAEADPALQPRWFRVIRQRLLDSGEAYENPAKSCIELAQKLLSNPLNRCLAELMTVTDTTNTGE